MTDTMTAEQITKARQMLAQEVSNRKVYADALEAVNALETLSTTKAEIEEAITALTAEKAQLDADCDKAALALTAAENKAKEIVFNAETEAARTVNAAVAKAKEIEDESDKAKAEAETELDITTLSIGAKKEELAAVEAKIAEANNKLEAIREKLKGI